MSSSLEGLYELFIPFTYITNKDAMEYLRKDKNLKNIDDILNLPKGIQITAFSYIEDKSLPNFLKLRENKKAMTLLYEFLFQSKKVSLEDFLKSNADYELQSYFYINHLYLLSSSPLYENEIDIDKLDEKAQIIIIKKIILIVKEFKNLTKLKLKKKFEILVQKFLKDILPLIKSEKDFNIHIQNILQTNIDYKFQSILFFLILEETNFTDEIKKKLFLKVSKKSQTIIINIWEKLEYEPGFFCDIINKIDIDVLTECFMEQKYSTKIYQNFIGIFSKRKKIAFRHFKIQTQIEIINDAPKEKKNIYFAILPDEYRTKETLSKIKDIEHEDAEKNVTDKKKDLKKDNKDENTIKIGISREAFKERLKMFDKKK